MPLIFTQSTTTPIAIDGRSPHLSNTTTEAKLISTRKSSSLVFDSLLHRMNIGHETHVQLFEKPLSGSLLLTQRVYHSVLCQVWDRAVDIELRSSTGKVELKLLRRAIHQLSSIILRNILHAVRDKVWGIDIKARCPQTLQNMAFPLSRRLPLRMFIMLLPEPGFPSATEENHFIHSPLFPMIFPMSV